MTEIKKLNIRNTTGLSFEFLENGALKSIEVVPVRISLRKATPYSRFGANLYLRNRSNPFLFKALLGPESNSQFTLNHDSFIAKGNWDGLDYTCVLQLSKISQTWRWKIDIVNTSDISKEIDLIYLQDVGLKPATDGLINEYYVSQYTERLILEDQLYGSVICCRQNMKEATGNPWLLIMSENTAVSACVDGMQFYGKTYRETGIPEGLIREELGGEYAGESSIVALQQKPYKLAPGNLHKSIFIATYLADHPRATSVEDLKQISKLIHEFDNDISTLNQNELFTPAKNIFRTSSYLPVDDLNDEELDQLFDKDKRHPEIEYGHLLSFFYGQNNHVVLRKKEIVVDRPHGHIMQAKTEYIPNENIISTTSYAFGVFNSHLTQGNTNFNIFLSVSSNQFGLAAENGQRVFIEIDGVKFLLGVPSAFEMGLNHCRWIYKYGGHCFQIRTWTSKMTDRVNMDFKVLEGKKVRLIITHHFDESNGWKMVTEKAARDFVFKPKVESMIADKFPKAQFRIIVNSNSDFRPSGDEALYPDNQSRGDSFFVLNVDKTKDFCMSFIGEVCTTIKTDKIEDSDKQYHKDCSDAQTLWNDLCLNLSLQGNHKDTAAIQEILPWFGMNAMTHFLTPYGLEQFGGAAWGTRDVSQGPLDLLLCMGKYDPAREVLRIIFSNQNPEGDWPQWWMFDSYFNIRAGDSHGDIYYWCIIALSNYIKVTGDLTILGEILPYFHKDGYKSAEKTPLSEHIDRLINMIVNSFIPGTALVPFGGGDWNDSLQPVSKELAQRMISSWTVEMNYQAFSQYQKIYERVGNTTKSSELKEICEHIKKDFNKYLIKDGLVAGYGLVEEDRSISVLLHPSDLKTNIRYSILPMNRGIISEMFTKEQATHHQDIIEQHLKGPDGARLMDRPLKYKGGIQTIFQRAESSTFFGREIGLMYVHEHIRYAESQAITGRADAFLKALRQANPVAYRDIVNCGDIRQSNCYYSSSDVTFRSRYDADERYDEIKTGKITLKGGWRVYSSGPGIYIALIVSRLLGLRTEFGNTILDPVIPDAMDGLIAKIDYMNHQVTFKYTVKENNFGPNAILINGKTINFSYEENKYRKGGAVIPTNLFLSRLDQHDNLIEIKL